MTPLVTMVACSPLARSLSSKLINVPVRGRMLSTLGWPSAKLGGPARGATGIVGAPGIGVPIAGEVTGGAASGGVGTGIGEAAAAGGVAGSRETPGGGAGVGPAGGPKAGGPTGP